MHMMNTDLNCLYSCYIKASVSWLQQNVSLVNVVVIVNINLNCLQSCKKHQSECELVKMYVNLSCCRICILLNVIVIVIVNLNCLHSCKKKINMAWLQENVSLVNVMVIVNADLNCLYSWKNISKRVGCSRMCL